jgi:hypothetical protein
LEMWFTLPNLNSSWSSTTATTTQMENCYCCVHCSIYH